MRLRSSARPHESPPPPPPSPEKGAAAVSRQQPATDSTAGLPPGIGAAPSLLHGPAAARLRAAAAADAAAPRADFLWAPPCWLHKPLSSLLEDPRDLPILFLLLNVLLTTVPAAAALFALFPPAARPLPHWLGAAYLAASFGAYLARFMLSLHYSQHRRLFRDSEDPGPGGKEAAWAWPSEALLDGELVCDSSWLGVSPSRTNQSRCLPNPCPGCRPVAPQPGGPRAAGAPVWRAVRYGHRAPVCRGAAWGATPTFSVRLAGRIPAPLAPHTPPAGCWPRWPPARHVPPAPLPDAPRGQQPGPGRRLQHGALPARLARRLPPLLAALCGGGLDRGTRRRRAGPAACDCTAPARFARPPCGRLPCTSGDLLQRALPAGASAARGLRSRRCAACRIRRRGSRPAPLRGSPAAGAAALPALPALGPAGGQRGSRGGVLCSGGGCLARQPAGRALGAGPAVLREQPGAHVRQVSAPLRRRSASRRWLCGARASCQQSNVPVGMIATFRLPAAMLPGARAARAAPLPPQLVPAHLH